MTTTENRPAIIADRPISQVPKRLRRYLSLDDFEDRALRFLPIPIAGYVSGIVETGKAQTNEADALSALALVPKIMRDVSQRNTRKTLMGETFDVPFAIAPMGFSALVAYDGDVVLSQAARNCGTFAMCSASSMTPLERVAEAGGSQWFQCYVPGDTDRIKALIARLLAAGFDKLVVTGDVPVASNRENNTRNGFETPFRLNARLVWHYATRPRWTIGTFGQEVMRRGMPHFENMDAEQGPPLFSKALSRSILGRDRLTWDHVKLMRDLWPGKLVVKGILATEDAVEAQKAGCDGIVVSSHGGRQLDATVAPIAALPAIRAAVPDMAVMIDGSFRRGTDVIKALALGADFVLIGRPFLYAATLEGVAGVEHAIGLLKNELQLDLAMLGLNSFSDPEMAQVLA